MKNQILLTAAAVIAAALALTAAQTLESLEQRFRQQVASYSNTTSDMTIALRQGFSITKSIEIPANPHGATLTITSADPKNPVTLKRAVEERVLFQVANGSRLMLKDIVIDGNKDRYTGFNRSLFYVAGALKMSDGAILRHNISGAFYGSGVLITDGGQLTMAGGEISDNRTGHVGGGVYVGVGCQFTMTDGKISGNEGTNGGGGVYVASGKFTMTGGEISGNKAKSDGGGVWVHLGEFDMTGGKICNNTARNGGGVTVNDGGEFTITNGEISGNSSEIAGGGVIVIGQLMMNGGKILNNIASSQGGGVYVNPRGDFTMTSGEIRNNVAAVGGSGVAVVDVFTMSGGEIGNNTVNIKDNVIGDGYGGGVYVLSQGQFKMDGGKISDNVVKWGGGVFAAGRFAMTGSEIIDNKALEGGGALVLNQFRMTGGKITGNTVYTGFAGGVFVAEEGEFKRGENAVIRDNNTVGADGGKKTSNVHMEKQVTEDGFQFP